MTLDCRIAVISNDALGNYVVATPLIQMLKQVLSPVALHYYSGTRTQELWSLDPGVDWGFPFFGKEPAEAIRAWGGKEYDLVVNMEEHPWAKSFAAVIGGEGYIVGPCIGGEGRGDLAQPDDEIGALAQDRNWTALDLLSKYPILKTPHVSEIFCRLAYLAGPIPPYRVVHHKSGRDIPDVLIATAASLADKLWPLDKWREILTRLRAEGLSIGLLGAKPADQRKFWQGDSTEDVLVQEGLVEDLRGELTLPEVSGALAEAKLVLTIDNGILHLACATPTPVVGLFRWGIHRLWAPPSPNLTVLTSSEQGSVEAISTQSVKEAVRCALNGS